MADGIDIIEGETKEFDFRNFNDGNKLTTAGGNHFNPSVRFDGIASNGDSYFVGDSCDAGSSIQNHFEIPRIEITCHGNIEQQDIFF